MRLVTIIKNGLPLIALLICGCSSSYVESWDKTVLSPGYWNRLTIEQQAQETRQQIEQSLARDDVEQAQKSLRDSRRENLAEDLLADLYTVVENRLLHEAEQASTAGHPDRAGRLFRMAQEIYPAGSQLQSTIDLSLDEIAGNIEQCADKLMKSGLIAYRSGELVSAIKIWGKIGRFHPDHSPSQVAIGTAERQLKSLEMLESREAM